MIKIQRLIQRFEKAYNLNDNSMCEVILTVFIQEYDLSPEEIEALLTEGIAKKNQAKRQKIKAYLERFFCTTGIEQS